MERFSGIADASQPNAGRIYDYLLGGSHNFEIDRQAAQSVLQIAPFFPKYFRLIRWFLGEATRRLCAEGFDKFIDFGSGLPTVDHIHNVAPPGTKVIYSDFDPVTVAYGQQIVGDNPNVRVVQCDAAEPERLLNSAEVRELFGADRRIAFGFNGVAWFLPDETLARSLRTLHNWAGKGSKLFLCDNDVPDELDQSRKVVDLYQGLQKLYIRSLDTVRELINPWKVIPPGFLILEEWMGMELSVSNEMKQAFGGLTRGAILEKV